MPVVEREAEDGTKADDERHERVQEPVDRALERRAGMAERARLAGDPGGEAVGANGGDDVRAGSLCGERAGTHLLADDARSGLGLAGEHRLVQLQIRGGDDAAIGDHLLARFQQDEVVNDDVGHRYLVRRAVPLHPRARRHKQRELVERALGLDLLADSDRGVRDDDPQEQRVAGIAEDQRDRAEPGEDRVEHREHVRPDDARVGSARRSNGPVAGRGETAGGLGLAQPGRRRGVKRAGRRLQLGAHPRSSVARGYVGCQRSASIGRDG